MQQNEVEIVISDHCGSELDSDDDKNSEEVNYYFDKKNDFNWFEHNLVHHQFIASSILGNGKAHGDVMKWKVMSSELIQCLKWLNCS